MQKTSQTIDIAGIKRELPLFEAAPGVKILLFNTLGDTEIIVHTAKKLAEKMPKSVEVIVTPEVKSIPLAYELSRITNVPYIVIRKIRKPYMEGAVCSEVVSITTGKPQTLWLDGKDLELIKGKNVALVDDVISTGSTLDGMNKLMDLADAKVIAEMAIFTEGDEKKWKNVIALGNLPVFVEK
jgi:adenine phosphoribosyltransferase